MKREERFDVGDRPNLDVEVPAGSVEIRTGAPGRISIVVDSHDAVDWDVTRLGDTVSIEPAVRRGIRQRSARVRVEVPAVTDLDVRTVSADVTGFGALGSVRVRTASGDVRVDDVARLDVSSAAGDVHVRSVAGDVSCATASGEIDAGEVAGRLTVSSASGDVRVARVGDEAQVESASGDVRVEHHAGAAIAVKTIAGDIDVGLPAGIRVEPDISTLSGRTTIPAPSAGRSPGERRVVRVRLRSVSGDIVIRRVDAD